MALHWEDKNIIILHGTIHSAQMVKVEDNQQEKMKPAVVVAK
jgi:hypothetical protein